MSTVRDAVSPERIAEEREILTPLRDSLRAFARDERTMFHVSGGHSDLTAGDRQMMHRERAILGNALYTLWNHSLFDVHLTESDTPWRVSLTWWDTAYGLGESYTSAAEALALAIDSALVRLEAEEGRS